MLNCSVSTAQFGAMCRDFAKLTQSGSVEEAVTVQTGKVLEACIRMTPARKTGVKLGNSISSITVGSSSLVWFSNGMPINPSNVDKYDSFLIEPSSWNGRGPAPRFSFGGTMHIIGGGNQPRRWSNERWSRAMALKSAYLTNTEKAFKKLANSKELMLARGLSKKSWWEIGIAMGLNISCQAFVKNARASNGKSYTNGTARQIKDGSQMIWEIENAMPLVVKKLGGASILQSAINSRVSAFKMEMSKGVFMDMKTRTQRYPGISFK